MDELLHEFLSSPAPAKIKCRTCACAKAAALVKDVAELKAKGQAHHTWAQVRRFLKAKMGFVVSETALLRHVKECL